MQTIKKYSNRKLYHTNRKQYITLEGIAGLIQRGEQVQVIDNETGEDITAPILAQVVLQGHDRKNPLPITMLTGLIQAGGDTLAGLRRSVWTAVSGHDHADDVDAEIARRLDHLRAAGQLQADEHARLHQLLVNAALTETHGLNGMSNTSDIARLSAQVDTLTAAVEQLLAEREARNRDQES
jgi:polyhydroxyalkanoate synthesis repressor PhaR